MQVLRTRANCTPILYQNITWMASSTVPCSSPQSPCSLKHCGPGFCCLLDTSKIQFHENKIKWYFPTPLAWHACHFQVGNGHNHSVLHYVSQDPIYTEGLKSQGRKQSYKYAQLQRIRELKHLLVTEQVWYIRYPNTQKTETGEW